MVPMTSVCREGAHARVGSAGRVVAGNAAVIKGEHAAAELLDDADVVGGEEHGRAEIVDALDDSNPVSMELSPELPNRVPSSIGRK